MQHIQVGIGVEREGLGLVEALGAHGALGLGAGLLLSGQAAGGDLGSLQESRHDVVIAVLADDFLGQVRLADLDVLTPAGRDDLHSVAVGFEGDLELQTVQDVEDGIGGHGDAQDGVDAADGGGEVLTLTRGTGGAIEVCSGDFAAAQFLNEVQGAGHAQLGGVLRNTLFVMAGGIGVLAQAAGGLADVVAGKLGALEEQLGGAVFDLAVQAAHNAGQGNGLGTIADDQVIGGQLEVLLVQGGDLLTILGAADDDLAAFQRVHIEGVHRLADLQHDVVGDVNDVGDAAQAAQGQLALHPARRGAGGDVADIVADVARAEVRGLDGDGQTVVGGVGDGIVGGGHLEGLAQHGGNFAGDAEDALAIGTVGGDGDVKNVIIQTDNFLNGGAGNGILGQVEQAVDLSAGIQVVVQAQFLAAAEHAIGLNTHQGLGLDLDAAGQRGAVQSGGGVHALVNVRSAGGDLDVVAVLAAVYFADMQVGALLRNALGDNADNDLADLAAEINEFFDLKAAAKELIFQLLCGDVNINILF